MAGTLTKDQILDGIAELSVIQLSELLKDFEERFGVTAAAPVAVAAAAAAGRRWRRRRWPTRRRSEFDVILTERRRQEDPGHQGSPCPHQPGPQGGQGPGRGGSQAGAREGQQGRRRQGQGRPRGGRRHRRGQVVRTGPGRAAHARSGAGILDGGGGAPVACRGAPGPARSGRRGLGVVSQARLWVRCRVAVRLRVLGSVIPAVLGARPDSLPDPDPARPLYPSRPDPDSQYRPPPAAIPPGRS